MKLSGYAKSGFQLGRCAYFIHHFSFYILSKFESIDWFVCRYPERWYLDITSGTRFYSLAAVDPLNGHILGFIVCDVKPLAQVNKEVECF